MIGMILVTHGRLALELRAAMEHVVGLQAQMITLCIGPEDGVDVRCGDMREAVALVDSGDGVVVLTDMLGGTPSNLACSVLDRPDVEVIAGVNLPLLVKVAKLRGSVPLPDLVDQAVAAGRKYMTSARVPKADGAPKPEAALPATATAMRHRGAA